MVRFSVSGDLFAAFPDACFGVVVAEMDPLDPGSARARALEDSLARAVAAVRQQFEGIEAVRAHPNVRVWRDAFTRLGWNPNKFMSSIEAMLSRIAKGGNLPGINPVVNAANTACLTNLVPAGAHDIDSFDGDIELRLSVAGDTFVPFGCSQAEDVPPGELVYVSGGHVRTRKWVWRQSEIGKITTSTRRVFFPVDGFESKTGQSVRSATDGLEIMCREALGAKSVTRFWVDSSKRCVDLVA